jgi:circadian clock protein KaiC
MNGGYIRGSSILITGTSGTGKTTLASTFVRAACERDEKVLYIDFEESADRMMSGMLSAGIDLRPAREAGRLQYLTGLPEAMGAEEHLIRAFRTIETFQPEHVVVDAISACSRMGSEQAAFEYVMRLVNTCAERDITVFLINQTDGFQDETQISGVGISSVIDAVIFLRYAEAGGEINRLLLILKMRGSRHSNQYREYRISDQGIDVADVYVGEAGVLTGTARQVQEARDAEELRLQQLGVQQKEQEIAQNRSALKAAEAELERLQLEAKVRLDSVAQRSRMRGEDHDSERR